VAHLKHLYPGETIKLRIDGQHRLLELVHQSDPVHSLHVKADGDGFSAQEIARSVEIRQAYATASIEDSLFQAAQDAGLPDNLTMELATIFGWDIDFALDIREGDHFTVVYEQRYLNGKKIGDGDIIAAEFSNRGKTYRAVRYTDASGHTDYYSPDGRSMRKAFLRTPVKFTRISSRFSLHRMHPILNRIRAHKGVDYAAPTGTPIRATGDGKVTFRGRKGGYGRVVVIQHGHGYSTLYGHMSAFNRRVHVGTRVKQGQVIGYVGMSGLATGPHLHYEFRIHGVHRNPLTVKLPTAQPLPRRYRADFQQHLTPLIAQLEVLDRSRLARN
jgi:murein DD-endopeptidase MepM/ murein hydrolase activator NlpD